MTNLSNELIGRTVTVKLTKWDSNLGGIYLGVQDRGEGPKHYFADGFINRTSQVGGQHGFPVTNAHDVLVVGE